MFYNGSPQFLKERENYTEDPVFKDRKTAHFRHFPYTKKVLKHDLHIVIQKTNLSRTANSQIILDERGLNLCVIHKYPHRHMSVCMCVRVCVLDRIKPYPTKDDPVLTPGTCEYATSQGTLQV